MKPITLALLVLLTASAFAQYNYKNLDAKTDLTADQLKLYTFENLRIYPIYAKETFVNYNKNIGKYTPLKEALEKQKVKITETTDDTRQGGPGPTVNTLYIQNTSNDTVYLMGGEVVKGGKQDRVIAQDVILPPKGKKIDLGVYCVEHGRWTGNSPSGATQFNSTYGASSTSVRKAAEVTKDQSNVWEKVKEANVKNKTETSTGTYTALDKSVDYKAKLDKYVAFFKNQLAKEQNVIGFVAASGDKIIGCDMFATSVLFSQQMNNLLQSYATEAITNGSAVKISNATAKAYMDKLLTNEATQKEMIKKDGKEFKLDAKPIHISIY